MSKVSTASIEKFQEILSKDPRSKVFAPLADAYRELGMLNEAASIAARGTQYHPSYVSGFVAYGRILLEQKKLTEALPILTKATELDTQNLLALHLLGNLQLQLKNPKAALKAFKMVLFLNPHSEKARKAIEKLESLTADEFEDEVFEMKPLGRQAFNPEGTMISTLSQSPNLDRQLSLVDALIVRGEAARAKEVLEELRHSHPESREVQSRWDLISNEDFETATPLKPQREREKKIIERKISRLEAVLHKLEDLRT